MVAFPHVACCALLLTLSTLFSAGGAVVELIADLPVKFLDDEKKPKYIIAIDRDGDAVQPPPLLGERTLQMADKTGKKFTCRLPAADQPAAPNTTSAAAQAEMSANKHQTPSEILDGLTALCFYRAEDWWTYEVCYQKHVRQFHREQAADGSTKLAVEYSLGVFNASVTDADVILVDTSPGQKDLKYVSQMYDSGDACDITGGKRSAEVRYSCGESAKDLIVSIKEPSTCHYIMNVRTPRLCQHPKFRVEQVPVVHVLCSAVPDHLTTARQEVDEESCSGDSVRDAAANADAAEQQAGGDAADSAAADEAADVGLAEQRLSRESSGAASQGGADTEEQAAEAAPDDEGATGGGGSSDARAAEADDAEPALQDAAAQPLEDAAAATDGEAELQEGGQAHEAADH